MMVVTRSSETSVVITVTRRNIPEDGILHRLRRKNLKSYNEFHKKEIMGFKCLFICRVTASAV
jgi:hypothetical protein